MFTQKELNEGQIDPGNYKQQCGKKKINKKRVIKVPIDKWKELSSKNKRADGVHTFGTCDIVGIAQVGQKVTRIGRVLRRKEGGVVRGFNSITKDNSGIL